MNEQSLAAIKAMQLGEITEHVIYGYMARRVPGENGRTLARIAAEEKKHAEIWSGFTGEMPKPNRLKIALYRICGVIFGLTFVINMMETGEQKDGEQHAEDVRKQHDPAERGAARHRRAEHADEKGGPARRGETGGVKARPPREMSAQIRGALCARRIARENGQKKTASACSGDAQGGKEGREAASEPRKEGRSRKHPRQEQEGERRGQDACRPQRDAVRDRREAAGGI